MSESTRSSLPSKEEVTGRVSIPFLPRVPTKSSLRQPSMGCQRLDGHHDRVIDVRLAAGEVDEGEAPRVDPRMRPER